LSTECVAHDQCDAQPMVTFPAKENCHSLTAVYFPILHRVGGWILPEWLVTYQDGIPANSHLS